MSWMGCFDAGCSITSVGMIMIMWMMRRWYHGADYDCNDGQSTFTIAKK